MTQEEKLELAKEWYNSPRTTEEEKSHLAILFPELLENKDVKIRKAIFKALSKKDARDVLLANGIQVSDVLAWLEKQHEYDYPNKAWYDKVFAWFKKQVEQTTEWSTNLSCGRNPEPAETSDCEPTIYDPVQRHYKVGDWVVSPNGVCWHIDSIRNNRYEVSTAEGAGADWPLDTDIYRPWTINDIQTGDVIATGYGSIFINAGMSDDKRIFNTYCHLSCNGAFCSERSWFYVTDVLPATIEQCNLLFSAMKEAGYEWSMTEQCLRPLAESKDQQ